MEIVFSRQDAMRQFGEVENETLERRIRKHIYAKVLGVLTSMKGELEYEFTQSEITIVIEDTLD
jgi:hypothetical protein